MDHNLKKFKISWKAIALALLLTAAALTFIFLRIADPREILEVITDYPLRFLVLAILALCIAWVIDSFRIRTVSLSTGFVIPFRILLLTMIASHFLTLITPLTAGGFPLVIYVLYRHGMSIGQAAGIVTAAGLGAQIGLIAFVSLVLNLMVEIPPQIQPVFTYLKIIVALYGIGAIVLVIITSHGYRFRRFLERFHKHPNIALWFGTFISSFKQTFSHKGMYFLYAIVSGFCYFGLFFSAGSLILTGFQNEPVLSFNNLSLATLLGISPSFTPIPSGAGISEMFSIYMLDDVLSDEKLGAFIILWRTTIFYLPVALGCLCFLYLILVWAKSFKRKATLDKSSPE